MVSGRVYFCFFNQLGIAFGWVALSGFASLLRMGVCKTATPSYYRSNFLTASSYSSQLSPTGFSPCAATTFIIDWG